MCPCMTLFCTSDCFVGKQQSFCPAGGLCGKDRKDRPAVLHFGSTKPVNLVDETLSCAVLLLPPNSHASSQKTIGYTAGAYFKHDFSAVDACWHLPMLKSLNLKPCSLYDGPFLSFLWNRPVLCIILWSIAEGGSHCRSTPGFLPFCELSCARCHTFVIPELGRPA